MYDLSILQKGLEEWGMKVQKEQLDQFERYLSLLLEWNEKMNLTAIKDPEEVLVQHYLDSLSILKTPCFTNRKSLLDMGTGAGFPGIPIKILNPDMRVVLVDSLQKRTTFLNEVVSQLQLKNIEVIHARAEDIGQDASFREKMDLVVSRAVAELRILLEYCLPLVGIGGFFVSYKGPGVYQEMENTGNALKALGGKLENIQEVKVPFSERNHILVCIQKSTKTPKQYPRKPGTPKKSPL